MSITLFSSGKHSIEVVDFTTQYDSFKIVRFDANHFTDELWDRFFKLREELHHEFNPQDPLHDRKTLRKLFTAPEHMYESWRHLVIKCGTNKEELVGFVTISWRNQKSTDYEKEKHLGNLSLTLREDIRRQGVGTRVTHLMALKLQEQGKTKILGDYSTESGKVFCRKLKFTVASERALNRLYVKEIDWELMRTWQNVPARQDGVTIDIYEVMPDEIIKEYCTLYTNVSATAPDYASGDFEAHERMSPQDRRASEAYLRELGIRWVTALAKDIDGLLVDVSEIYYNPSLPTGIEQEMTAVLPSQRGRGVGKWLKAELVLFARERFPKAVFYTTGNANNNEAMLAINHKMGYRKHKSHALVSILTQDLVQNTLEMLKKD